MVAVWSEREPGGWHDCWLSAVLMPLVYAGFARFPLGAYTDAEREALDDAQSVVPHDAGGDFTAADQATAHRYGLTLHKLTAALAAELAHPGRAFALIGHNDRLPTRLRHWDPAFSGNHAATAVTRAGADPLFLDPEAPMGYGGDPITTAELLGWAYGGSAARFLAAGELAPVLAGYRVSIGPGTVTGYYIAPGTMTLARPKAIAWPHGSSAPAVRGATGYWYLPAGAYAGLYLVAGRSGPFTVQRIERYPDGTLRATTIPPTGR